MAVRVPAVQTRGISALQSRALPAEPSALILPRVTVEARAIALQEMSIEVGAAIAHECTPTPVQYRFFDKVPKDGEPDGKLVVFFGTAGVSGTDESKRWLASRGRN